MSGIGMALIVPQLYHTKLEQLTTLGNRLSALSRILGPEFYSQDIVGDGEYRDVTPEHFSKLEKELVRGKGEVVSFHSNSLSLANFYLV
jgi:protein regulator of cytokinesis 1